MTDDINNPDDGTEEVTAQAPDTTEEWDYYDPDEDNVEAPDTAATEDGTEEAAQEAEVGESAAIEAPLNAVVKMADGTTAKVSDLLQGNLRQADYTRKSQELATSRQAVEANLQRIEGITEAFIDHLTKLVPEAPDHALALRDPNAYTRQLAQHQAAMAQVQSLVEIGSQPKQIKSAITAENQAAQLAEENRMLQDRFPAIATREGRDKFFSNAAAVANDMGFSNDELSKVTDHRIFAMAHYAKIGMDAVKTRDAAKAKLQAAPQVSPRKPGQAQGGDRSAEAMRRFAKTPSVKNAAAAWDGS